MSAPSAGLSISGRPQKVDAAIRELFANPPQLHRVKDNDPKDDPAAEDGLVNWALQRSFLSLMIGLLTPSSLTLETGGGLSTVCMAIIGAEHICISPSQKEHNRIRRYCSDHGISTERIRFVPMKSHAALPSLDIGGRKLDFVLIDGAHAFPSPIIDYYFLNGHLKVGGLLALDDLPIPSVGILQKFLMTEPAYQLATIDEAKTALYRKVSETSYRRDWVDQKFNSRYPDLSFLDLGARTRHRLRRAEFRLREALRRVPGLRGAYHLVRDRSPHKNN